MAIRQPSARPSTPSAPRRGFRPSGALARPPNNEVSAIVRPREGLQAFLLLPGEPWVLLLSGLNPAETSVLRSTAVSSNRSVSDASLLLLARRFHLSVIPSRPRQSLKVSEVLVAAWRARVQDTDASRGDLSFAANFAAEHGFWEFFLVSQKEKKDEVSSLCELIDESTGVTPLHAAAAAGQVQTCEVLLELIKQLDTNAVWQALGKASLKGRTPLHSAAAKGDLKTVQCLLGFARSVLALDSNAQVIMDCILSALDRRQRSCALLALNEGYETCALTLINAQSSFSAEKGIDTSVAAASLLVASCERNSEAVAVALLKKGADPNSARSSDGALALVVAALHGSLAVLKTLLRHNDVDIDRMDRSGRTALHLACQLGQRHAVESLLEHRADPRIQAPGGRSALYIAAEHGSTGCVEVLLRSGNLGVADVLTFSSRLMTPFSTAQRRGHVAVVDTLVAFVSFLEPASAAALTVDGHVRRHARSSASPRSNGPSTASNSKRSASLGSEMRRFTSEDMATIHSNGGGNPPSEKASSRFFIKIARSLSVPSSARGLRAASDSSPREQQNSQATGVVRRHQYREILHHQQLTDNSVPSTRVQTPRAPPTAPQDKAARIGPSTPRLPISGLLRPRGTGLLAAAAVAVSAPSLRDTAEERVRSRDLQAVRCHPEPSDTPRGMFSRQQAYALGGA